MSCGYMVCLLRGCTQAILIQTHPLQLRNICYEREGLDLTSITDTVNVILKFIYLEDLRKTTVAETCSCLSI
jgi:hypothetical protein